MAASAMSRMVALPFRPLTAMGLSMAMNHCGAVSYTHLTLPTKA
jgi:hypothetical protein